MKEILLNNEGILTVGQEITVDELREIIFIANSEDILEDFKNVQEFLYQEEFFVSNVDDECFRITFEVDENDDDILTFFNDYTKIKITGIY